MELCNLCDELFEIENGELAGVCEECRLTDGVIEKKGQVREFEYDAETDRFVVINRFATELPF